MAPPPQLAPSLSLPFRKILIRKLSLKNLPDKLSNISATGLLTAYPLQNYLSARLTLSHETYHTPPLCLSSYTAKRGLDCRC